MLTQALLDGFNDRASVDEFIAQQGNQTRTMGEDKIKVALGTLRTKVLVQESKSLLHSYGTGTRTKTLRSYYIRNLSGISLYALFGCGFP